MHKKIKNNVEKRKKRGQNKKKSFYIYMHTAGLVIALFKMGWKSVNFPSHF